MFVFQFSNFITNIFFLKNIKKLNKKTEKPYLPLNVQSNSKHWELFCLYINSSAYCHLNFNDWLNSEQFLEIRELIKESIEIFNTVNENLMLMADKMTRILANVLSQGFKIKVYELIEKNSLLDKDQLKVKIFQFYFNIEEDLIILKQFLQDWRFSVLIRLLSKEIESFNEIESDVKESICNAIYRLNSENLS